MIKPTDFGEIILAETDDYQLFSRKKLIKTYNKYKDIRTAFKHNKLLWCFDGQLTRQILTKQELKLILQEISDYAYKYRSKDEARYDFLKYYHDQLTECVFGMKELIDNLPEKDNTTHYDCECGSKVLMSHKARHLNSPLHLNFVNKVEPKAKVESVVQCGCGKKYTTNNKTHHDKTQNGKKVFEYLLFQKE